MKKIGSKVLLMMVLFVVIFGLNTITSVRSKSCKTVWIRNHGAVYSNSDRNIYDSKKYGTRSEIP